MADNTLRFVKVDYQSHKDALLQRVRSRWLANWNDFLFHGQSSFGTVLVDLMAWSASTLAFLVNRLAGENFIMTMTLRESAQRIGSLVGYQLRGPTPAVAQCEATLSGSSEFEITLPKGTLTKTSDGLPFEVTQDYIFPAGSVTPVTPVITLSATDTSPDVVATNVKAIEGSTFIDLVDSTIDLTSLVELGQSVRFVNEATDETFKITAITGADASGINNRLVVDPPITGLSAASVTVEAIVFDGRVTLSQGQTVTEKFLTPAVETPGYLVKLAQLSVIDGSTDVTINGEAWNEAESFYASQAEDHVYQLKTMISGATVLQFGDGQFGAVVPTDAVVAITYRIGGGTIGNITLNAISSSVSGFISGTTTPVTVQLKNESTEGQGGLDAESVEEARTNIPFVTRTNDRAVTLDDYQTLAQRFSSPQHGAVAYARAAVPTNNSTLEGNLVIVHAWTRGAGETLTALGAPLKAALKAYLQSKAVATDYVIVADGTERPTPVSLRFKVLEGFPIDETRNFILKTLKGEIVALRPGSPIIYSNMLRALDEAFGVDNLDMATPISDLTTSNSTELFTVPQDDFTYTIDRAATGSIVSPTEGGVTIGLYNVQLPVAPVAAWSLRLFIGTFELAIFPDTTPGLARLYRSGVLSTSNQIKSTINLLTGQVTLAIKGAQGPLTMRLVTAQGYDRERPVNLYIGYTGVSTQAKRREIREVLKGWARGLRVGGSIYATEIEGIIQSKANVTDTVEAVSGITAVTRVALETPASSATKVDATATELLKLGLVVVNNQAD
jgi:hypothetical protein